MSLLAPCYQQEQQHLVDKHATVVLKRSDNLSESSRFTKRTFYRIVRQEDSWLANESEPVVKTSFDLPKE